MPAKMTPSLGYCPKCDGPLVQPPSFPQSMDQAFRSFGQPPPNFGSLDDLMRDMGGNNNSSTSTITSGPRQPLWRHGHLFNWNRKEETVRTTTKEAPRSHLEAPSSTSSSSSSSVRYDGRGGGGSRLLTSAQNGLGGPEIRASEHSGPDRFAISIDVHDYRPEEIKVKTVDNTVVIEGRHEESRAGGPRYVSRNFSRSWTIPSDVDPANITSSLSGDGRLTVEAPRRPQLAARTRDQVIPVHHGNPSRRYF